MKPLIVANWKMNPQTLAEAKDLFDKVVKGAKDAKNAEVIVCPPFVYISDFKPFNPGFSLGGQDCFWEEGGAYTGEVSPRMLKNFGCEYVILGHSERRRNFGETDEMINKKVKAAQEAGLKVILCIGETAQDRKDSKTNLVLDKQLKLGSGGLGEENLIIAYEPVWAIGTGNACDTKSSKEVLEFIKKQINTPVLYGGSVDSECALRFVKEAGFDGLLVGGASLKPEEFIKIIKSI